MQRVPQENNRNRRQDRYKEVSCPKASPFPNRFYFRRIQSENLFPQFCTIFSCHGRLERTPNRSCTLCPAVRCTEDMTANSFGPVSYALDQTSASGTPENGGGSITFHVRA